jgi:hypothetical protein
LDQQAAIYKVEGVDEDAPAAQQQKKKRKANNDEVGRGIASHGML